MSDFEDPYVRRQLRALAGRAPDAELGLSQVGGRLERARRRRVVMRGVMASAAGVTVISFAAVAAVTAKPSKTNVRVTADHVEQSTSAPSTTGGTIVVVAGKGATSVTLPAPNDAGMASAVTVPPAGPAGTHGHDSGSSDSQPVDHAANGPAATGAATNATPPEDTGANTVPPPVVTPPEPTTSLAATTTAPVTSQPSTTKGPWKTDDEHSDTTDN